MSAPQLPVVARCLADDLQRKLAAAMQIIAALVLTEEEVHSMTEHYPLGYSWTETMKKELLEDRAKLVEVLRVQGFLCNTSTQHVLNPLENHLGSIYVLEKVTESLNKWAKESVRAKEVLPLPKGGPSYQEAQDRVMRLEGANLLYQVKMEIMINA